MRNTLHNVLWGLGKIAPRTSTDNSSAGSYIVRFLDNPGPITINLPPFYTTSRNAFQGSSYLRRHQAGGLTRGVLRNAGEPRGPPPSVPPFSEPFPICLDQSATAHR